MAIIKLVHNLDIDHTHTHTHQIKLVELARMHTGLYITEKTTIFILPGYTYLPPSMHGPAWH
jgi:hypothetical protein